MAGQNTYVAEAVIRGTRYQWVGSRRVDDPDEVQIIGAQYYGDRWHYFPAIAERAYGDSVEGVVEGWVSRFCAYSVDNGFEVIR